MQRVATRSILGLLLLSGTSALRPPPSSRRGAPSSRAPARAAALAVAAAARPVLAGTEAAVAQGLVFEPRGITPEDTVIFVIGCVPFVWAGIEFWRRIAVGDSFGTGRDSVIINDTSGNRKKPLQRVLGQDAIIAARILFGIAGLSGALVLLSVGDVLLKG